MSRGPKHSQRSTTGIGSGYAARLGVSFAAILVARVVSTAIQAFMLVLLARQMMPHDFGVFSSVLALVTLGIGLSDAGLQSYAIRERASELTEARIASARTYRASAAMTWVVAALVATVGGSLGLGPGHGFGLVGICIVAWLERQMNARLGLAIASGLARSNVYVVAVGRGISLLLFASLPVTETIDPLMRYLIAVIVGTTCALAISVIEARVPKSAWLPTRLDFRASLPFWTAGVWTQIRTIDVPVVSAIAGAGAAGAYALPIKAGQPVKLLPAVFSSLGQPAAVKGDRRALALLDRGVWACTFAGAVVWLVVVLVGPSLVTALVGNSYAGAFVPLVLVLAGFVANIPGVYLSGVLVGAGLEAFVSRWDLYVTLLYFSALVPMAIADGATGAALAFLISNLLQAAGVYWQRQRWNRLANSS